MRLLFEDANDGNRTLTAYINSNNLLYIAIEDRNSRYEGFEYITLDLMELNQFIEELEKCRNELKQITQNG